MRSITLTISLLLCCCMLSGCTTPRARIKKNQEAFATYPEEVQVAIREGRILPGFDESMVLMAAGKPARRYTRTTADGLTQVWAYTSSYTTPSRQRVKGTFRIKDASGRYRTVTDTIWVDIAAEHEYEIKRVEFVDGVVSAVENVNEQPLLKTGI